MESSENIHFAYALILSVLILIIPVHANLTPIWGWWTFLRFKDLPQHSGYVFFFPRYALLYGLMTVMTTLIIRSRIHVLTFIDLFKNILISTFASTFLGFFSVFSSILFDRNILLWFF